MLHLLSLAGQVADPTIDTCRKAFIGAVAVRQDGRLVHSRNGSVPRPHDINPPAHAEARLIRKTGYGAVVYVARQRRDGSLAMAKPCTHCMSALRSMRVELVYWTVSNDDWDACRP